MVFVLIHVFVVLGVSQRYCFVVCSVFSNFVYHEASFISVATYQKPLLHGFYVLSIAWTTFWSRTGPFAHISREILKCSVFYVTALVRYLKTPWMSKSLTRIRPVATWDQYCSRWILLSPNNRYGDVSTPHDDVLSTLAHTRTAEEQVGPAPARSAESNPSKSYDESPQIPSPPTHTLPAHKHTYTP